MNFPNYREEWQDEQEHSDEIFGAPDEIITGCESEQSALNTKCANVGCYCSAEEDSDLCYGCDEFESAFSLGIRTSQ